MKYYITSKIERRLIVDYLKNLDDFISMIIFFIDIKSFARGFYVNDVMMYEASNYFDGGKPIRFIEELRNFCYITYDNFIDYKPRFIIFYDNGKSLQNKSLFSGYKSNRIGPDPDIDNLRKSLMSYYLDLSKRIFTIDGVSSVIDSEDYECDFIPYYLIKEFTSKKSNILNVIISYDKDLLQACIFNNTIQIVPPINRNYSFNIYNKNNCIRYIYKKFREGILDASHIALILSISGDPSDNIRGVDGFGPKKACDIIIRSKSKSIEELSRYFNIEEFNIIKFNYDLISFDRQIERIPIDVLEKIKSEFKTIWRE
ncbi:MAG: hypothetical protein QXD03_03285 [Candidatus Anstonellales archaeon]